MLKLGVMACIHGNSKAAARLSQRFKKARCDAIVLAGDINSDEKPLPTMKAVMAAAARTKLPVFAIPGSHEPIKGYAESVRTVRKRYPNLKDCSRKANWRFMFKGQELIFLPGSDWLGGHGEYQFLPSAKEVKARREKMRRIRHKPNLKFFFMTKIPKPRHPKKALFICHVPPLFKTRKAIDIAIFGVAAKTFLIHPKHAKLFDMPPQIVPADPKGQRSLWPVWIANKLIRKKYPLKILKHNRGNRKLGAAMRKRKFTKYIGGHFHESGGRAIDRKGKSIKQNKWNNELFVNTAPTFKGRGAILTLDGDNAKYRFIRVKAK